MTILRASFCYPFLPLGRRPDLRGMEQGLDPDHGPGGGTGASTAPGQAGRLEQVPYLFKTGRYW
jgi:hypothetical protein